MISQTDGDAEAGASAPLCYNPRMALKVVRRKSTGAWTISGTVEGMRIQKRAQSNNKRLAEEEAAALETRLLREAWHGPRYGTKSFGEAALSYANAVARPPDTLLRLARLVDAVGESTPLNAIDQDAVARTRETLLKPGTSPATYIRGIITPLRAVLKYAVKQDWLERVPHFTIPKQQQGRTLFLLPAQAEALIAAAVQHIRPLLLFLIGTGARMSEALKLEWRDVDLVGGRTIFWQTKSGKRRVASLPPRVVAALAELSRREGRVFLSRSGKPYWTSVRNGGGQIKQAWRTGVRRARLDPELTPHDLRHTWATWHYGLNRDLLQLKQDGGWSSVVLVERYAHLLPAGHEDEIRRFLDYDRGQSGTAAACPLPSFSDK